MFDFVERFMALLYGKNFVTDQLATLEEKTGVKREFAVLGMLKAQGKGSMNWYIFLNA